ncbi:MAG: hypothetical protein V4692_08640, partial [Bdellovibrionota bacterium]
TSAPESGTTNEKEALAQLTDILKKNQDKTAANGAIDRSLETIFEDDGSYGVNDPRLKILEARREADRIQAEAERKAQAELRAALNANGTNAANTDGTVAPINSSKVIVFDGSAGVMPDAEDKINSLNVPESVRQEILNTYRRTGILPDFIAGEGDVSGRNPANNH